MVSVKTAGLFDGQFTRLFKDLYVKTSKKPLPDVLPYPAELKPYLDTLYGAFDLDYKLSDNMFPLHGHKGLDPHDSRCLCAFSGGKDSVANALLLRELGYEPILFFVKGINRSYPGEYDVSVELAKALDMELVTYSVSVSGKCDFVENPTKDQFILALMVDYGIKLGIGNYSFGCQRCDRVLTTSWDYMLSDCKEMFDSVELFYRALIPEFSLVNFLSCETESFCIINEHDISLLDKCLSCMTPLRYKGNLIKKNTEKYGVSLLPGRCGSCYKCCQEALVLSALGVVDYNQSFLDHCVDVIESMQSKFDKTSKVADTTPWIDYDVINKYLEG